MCAATRPLGPGPGAYLLPSLVGYDKHDARKQRCPQYSFGLKKPLKDRSVGPGPGAYKLGNLTRHGAAGGPAYSLGLKTALKSHQVGPGPGAHESHKCPIYKGNRPPAYSMGLKTGLKDKNINPGPAAYMCKIGVIRPGIPAYSMARRTALGKKLVSPGPAAYGCLKPCIQGKCPPAYSMTPRRPPLKPSVNIPGANCYDLQGYKPGDKGAAYSFGVHHSPYSPPMIVECDN